MIDDLPHHLASRCRPLGGDVAEAGGDFVLYWMRTAVRGHENPALDAALAVARRRSLPVLVYHALSERYPYASDRHHTFILEGARDVRDELGERGIPYVFHLERTGRRGPCLKRLAERAVLTVTEDLPVPFLDRWTERLAEAVPSAVVAVDAACLVPMRSVAPDVVDRAFRFRRATEPARGRAIEAGWSEQPDPDRSERPELPFEPTDLDRPIPDLVAACDIDHGVAPVPHTRGGSDAGYARWRRFVADGLKGYARHRNDPLADGTSRMSPYLHYGMVSPFRLAREAAAVGGKGAAKYLDELLVWRELAHAFCFHHRGRVETLEALPAWARQTLEAHAGDERSTLLSWAELALARSGDRLWDAAQRDLLRHGELHNNVRMTWGKALLGWSPTPAVALERAIDLNHRFALDGRDPSSYGGILWCFGGFDRAFPPERPVSGTVRPRPTEKHAARIDVDAYEARTGRPVVPEPGEVVVVGAGIAGLSCAQTLRAHGVPVRVVDKGRRLGGRCHTRIHRVGRRDEADETGEADTLRFDHGAQYFTARSEIFRRFVEGWRDEGVVVRWEGRIVRISGDEVEPAHASERWVGVPGMRAVAERLAAGVPVESGVRVTGLEAREDGRWWLQTEARYDDPPAEAEHVVLALPSPQAADLLDPVAPALAERVRGVEMAPCLAVMLDLPDAEVAFDAAFCSEAGGRGSPLTWVSRNGSKPGRPRGTTWILHGAPSWSADHLEAPEEEVVDALLAAFASLPGVEEVGSPSFVRAQRWRYASVPDPLEAGALEDPDRRLVVCGDWAMGSRIESAFRSGRAAAGRILRRTVAESGGRVAGPDQLSLL